MSSPKHSTPPVSFPNTAESIANPLSVLPNPAPSNGIPQLPHFGDLTYAPTIFYSHRYPVDKTMHAFFHKYPNPKVPMMRDVKILEEKVDPSTGVVYRKRTLTLQLEGVAPWWVCNLLRIKEAHFMEESHYDPKSKVFSMASRNVTYSNVILAAEYSKFVPHPENPNWTLFVQRGGVQASSWLGLMRSKFEEVAASKIRDGGADSCDILDETLIQIFG
jgi:hypothetical protein